VNSWYESFFILPGTVGEKKNQNKTQFKEMYIRIRNMGLQEKTEWS
jgi:hypothetical protein